jgi:hypothetical protein
MHVTNLYTKFMYVLITCGEHLRSCHIIDKGASVAKQFFFSIQACDDVHVLFS